MAWYEDPTVQRIHGLLGRNLDPEDRTTLEQMFIQESRRAKRDMVHKQITEEDEKILKDLGESEGPIKAAFTGMGNELMRLWEGARMLATDDDEAIMRERAERERRMAPLEEQRPVSTFIGSMLPGMALPGGVAGGLARRAATAGLAGAGYEGVGGGGTLMPTLTGAAGGAAGGLLGHLGQRFMFGNPEFSAKPADLDRRSPEHLRRLQQAQQIGYQVTPAGRFMNPSAAKFEASMARSPFSSAPFERIEAQNQSLANETAREAIGLQGDDILSDEVLESVHDSLGRQFNAIVGGDEVIEFTPDVPDQLRAIEERYGQSIMRSDRIRSPMKILREKISEGSMTVKDYQRQASDIARAARSAGRGDASMDPAYQDALLSMRELLDSQFDNSLGNLPQLQEVRRMYRNLKQLEKPGVLRKDGNVSLVSLRNRMRQEGQGRVRGTGPLETAAKVGGYFATDVPNSGTPTGMAMQNFFQTGPIGKAQILGSGAAANAYLNTGGMMYPGAFGLMPRSVVRASEIAPLLGRSAGVQETRGEGLLGQYGIF